MRRNLQAGVVCGVLLVSALAGTPADAATPQKPATTTPSAPRLVQSAPGDRATALWWAPPASTGGAPITDYRIQFSSNGKSWKRFADATSSSVEATVTGLGNGVEYVFRVAAVNAKGTGAYSAPTASVAPTPVDCSHPGPSANLAGCTLATLGPSQNDLAGANLAGADLLGADLTTGDLTGANLADANASGVIFYEASLVGANLSRAQVGGGLMAGANLFRAHLTGVDLRFTTLSTTTLMPADVEYTGLRSGEIVGSPTALGGSWVFAGGYLVGPTADLAGANLDGLDLSEADLALVESGGITGTPAALPPSWILARGYLVGPRANLKDADLSQLDLTAANLRDARLPRANLAGTTLAAADLHNATLTSASLEGADLTAADLTRVASGFVTGTPAALPASWRLVHGYLVGPDANLWQASLNGADLAGADLTGADLRRASLTGADLTGATLTNVTIDMADLSGATLSGVISGGITGTPWALPDGWALVDGTLVEVP